jgi:hypothetical protein
MTRTRLIQIWFFLVLLAGAVAVAFGPGMTIGTGALLLMLSCVPAAVLFMLCPAIQPPSAADVLYDRDRSK